MLGGAGLSVRAAPGQQVEPLDVIINEVAWGGTVAASNDEWIELYNSGSSQINLQDWLLISEGTPPSVNITLTGLIDPGEYFLLERQNNSVINSIDADLIYFGPGNLLDDEGDTLYLYAPNGAEYVLIDSVNNDGGPWPGGNAAGYGSMERYGDYEDSDSIWETNTNPDPANNTDFRGNLIYGTPKAQNWVSGITPITTTTITSDMPDPSVPNLPVKITVSVVGGPTTPAGTVNVTGGNQNCVITLQNGTGDCNITFATIGTKTLTATYVPTSNHTDSSDTETHQVIQGIQTTTTITNVSPQPASVNQNTEVTVQVVAASGATKPTGTVSITGANTNCTITLSNGTGKCNVRFSSIGTKELTATYNGETVFIRSVDTESIDVFLASTTRITADAPDPSRINQQVNVSVTVTGESTIPTGTVEITGANSNCTITLSGGTGNCNVNFTVSGTKTIRATYSGDDTYGVSSDTETHSVSFSVATPVPAVPSLPPIIGISEFLPRPGYDWNNDGVVDVFDEFIEIINAGRVDVNLSAYRVDDEEDQGSLPYKLPDLTLKPGERAVFYAAETGILLSDAGDTVRLLRGSTVVDAYTYGVVRYPDQSWCRIPDRLGYWNHPCFPTPNNPNSLTGTTPLPSGPLSGYQPPVCLLPDTTPDEFVYAECEAGGAEIWNRQYWDGADASERLKLDEPQKWETVFE